MLRRQINEHFTAYLKRVLQSHQKGKAHSLQDTFLVQRVFYLLQLDYLEGSGRMHIQAKQVQKNKISI